MRTPWPAAFALAALCAPAPDTGDRQTDSAQAPVEAAAESAAQATAAVAAQSAADTAGAGGFLACLAGPAERRLMLPGGLREISGLAVDRQGRLLAHSDERSEIGILDPATGRLIKAFGLRPTVAADFEAITVADDAIYLLVSDGRLFETREGNPNERVAYTLHETGLKRECEFEGMAYEPGGRSLLLLCKTQHGKGGAGLKFYRWSVPEKRLASPDPVSVELPSDATQRLGREFRGSALERDPATGNFVAIASLNRAVAVFTSDGKLVAAGPLARRHLQPEALAILPDGRAVVGDEGGKGPGSLTFYACGRAN